MKIVKNVRPPSGVSRALFRAPIYLYRLGLGWLFAAAGLSGRAVTSNP